MKKSSSFINCPIFGAELKLIFSYKHLTIIVLLTAFLAQIFSRTIIVVDYYTNTASYANDCINKNLPVMHCNGKCQMMKKFRLQENQDQQNPGRKQEGKTEIPFSSRSFFATLTLPYVELVSKRKSSFYQSSRLTKRSADIFHPPSFKAA